MSKTTLMLVSAGLLALSGCYEPTDVTVHEPGVYKGERDPLLATSVDKRREELMARFNQIQRDR